MSRSLTFTNVQGAADWLHLAATPTFAIMALVSAFDRGAPDFLCAAMHEVSPLNGMTLMYLLMSAFHLAPWLTLMPRTDG